MFIFNFYHGIFVCSFSHQTQPTLCNWHSIVISAATLAGIAVANGKNGALSFDAVEGYAGLLIVARSAYTMIYMTPSLNGILRTIAFAVGMVATVGFIFVAGSHYSALKA